MRHKYILTFVLGLLFLSGSFVHAQTLGADPLQFVVNPDTPAPGDTVTIEAQGIGGFLGDATITWQQNGKTILSGVGGAVILFQRRSARHPDAHPRDHKLAFARDIH